MLLKEFYTFLFCCLFVSLVAGAQNTPPKIVASGNQSYCPLSQINIVTNFDIVDPNNTEINAFYIQISEGYKKGEEQLLLLNIANHPNIQTSWDYTQGKLTLEGTNGGKVSYVDIIQAVKDVVFESAAIDVSGEKHFSFTIGEANYLPSTGHYYEYVPSIGISWTNAKTAASLRNYYGLQGYLATITSSDEAKLSGEQAAGAGWIGGSDAVEEGVWKWVTGPENGTIFWNGDTNGSSPTYAFWNTEEPNNLGDEDYAHVTAPGVGINGSWNDLSNTGATSGDYQPKGYVVEYGGMPGDPVIDLSASTKIYISTIESITDGSICGPGTIPLSVTASSGNVLWFDSASATTPIFVGNDFVTPNLTTSTIYYVLASEDINCTTGVKKEVLAEVYKIPVIAPTVTLKNCDEDGNPDGITNFNLREADSFITLGNDALVVSYYLTEQDAQSKINEVIASPFSNATTNQVYARAENSDGCFEISLVHLEVSTTDISSIDVVELTNCENDDTNDGIVTFDLTIATNAILDQLPPQNLEVKYYSYLSDAQLEEHEIIPQNSYKNQIPYYEELYVRVENVDNGDCFGIAPLVQLTVYLRPEFEVKPTATVCLNQGATTLETYLADGNYQYEWMDAAGNILGTNPTLEVTQGGNYTVTAISLNNCRSFSRTIQVKESEIAQISVEDIEVNDNSESNTIIIHTENLGLGDYVFALDDIYGPYQSEPIFENVFPGIHTIFIRDLNNCGIAQIEVSVIGYPKFFTPNNDGYNDTWQVQGIMVQPNSKIYIFDKFGKLLQQIAANGKGWDGYYGGKLLPSSDYWYMVELEDGRTHRGHFSLIRR